jgi:hypothetical protein
MASREQSARILKRKQDPFGQALLDFDHNAHRLKPSKRNHSILIHGYDAVGPEDEEDIWLLYRGLEKLLRLDAGEDLDDRLAIARSVNLSKV